jgi:hypothetical protein
VANIPLWVWQLGDAVAVAQPNEAYSYFQQELRQRYPGRAVAVLNVANGHIGYLPPRDHYSRDEYSVWQTPFAAGGLEVLTATAASTIDELLRPSPR